MSGDDPSTNRSLIRRAADPGPGRDAAFAEWLRIYGPVLDARLRVSWKAADGTGAADLLQLFVQQKILDGNLLGRYDPFRGKFRTYLLTALDPYASWLVTPEYAIAGQYTLVHPVNSQNGTTSHNAFPSWYARGAGQSPEVQDILNFEQVTPARAVAARSAANVPGLAPQVQAPYVAGGGAGLLIPLLEAAVEHAFQVLVDDVGHAFAVAALHAGDLVVTVIDRPGHAISWGLDQAGNVLKTVEGAASSLIDGLEHAAHKILHDLFGWLGF